MVFAPIAFFCRRIDRLAGSLAREAPYHGANHAADGNANRPANGAHGRSGHCAARRPDAGAHGMGAGLVGDGVSIEVFVFSSHGCSLFTD
jgi:hypothetical protein